MTATPRLALLLVHLDRHDGRPLSVQLADQVRDLIADGALATGDRLPSSRSWARDLEVSRSVVAQGYDQLLAEGWLRSARGSGTFVAPSTPAARRRARVVPRVRRSRRLMLMDTGTPYVDPRHESGWRRAWRDVSVSRPPETYADDGGLIALRAALCAHLARTRGLEVTTERLIITAGTTDGWRQLLAALDPGPVAIEDPGYRAAVEIARVSGRRVVDLRVLPEGPAADLDLAALSDDVRAAFVTPAHQHPLGLTMSAQARSGLLEWAARSGGVVVEDDYDSEFRYDVAPPPALASVDPERVVYLGTASKSVAPGLRLGWLAGPQEIVDRIVRRRRRNHDSPAWPSQHAYQVMLRDGHVDRLIRSARNTYAERSARITERLHHAGLDHLLAAPIAGMYVTLELEPERAAEVSRAAVAAGYELPGLEDYSRSAARHGVVLGFAGCTDDQLDEVLGVVVDTLTR